MLFVTQCEVRAGTSMERTARRLDYRYPEGLRVLGEWWLQGSEIEVVLISEADSVGPVMAARSAWDDVFDITVAPAVTAEEGIAIVRQAMAE